MSEKNIKLFTDSDLDGVSCAVVGKIVFENIDIMCCTPKNIDSLVMDFISSESYKEYDRVFITDLVLKPETIDAISLINDNSKFRVFDHHRSSIVYNTYRWVDAYEYLNNKKTCGAELFWAHLSDYYGAPDLPTFSQICTYIEYVRLWDTWDWVSAGDVGIKAKNLSILTDIYSKTKYIEITVDKLQCGNDLITRQEQMLLDIEDNKKNRYIQQKMKNVRILNLGEYSIGYVFAENYISELGNYMCKNVEGIKYAAIINADTEVVSLRTLKDSNIDLSEVAKSLSNNKGGGHPLSAGFVYSSEFNDKLIKDIFKVNE